jgi:hypothetical protein
MGRMQGMEGGDEVGLGLTQHDRQTDNRLLLQLTLSTLV